MSTAPAREPCDLLIHGGCVLTVDPRRRILDPGAVAVRGTDIIAVGGSADLRARFDATESVDARGATVHPGFIDAHNHIVHGTARGVFANADRSGGETVNFATYKAGVDGADERVATALASLELLRNGFTGFVEPGSLFDVDAAVEGIEEVGVRAAVAGTYLWDRTDIMAHLGSLEGEALFARAPESLERALSGLDSQLHRNRDPGGRVHGFVCLYGLGTASDELQRAARELADEHGVQVHQHEGYVPATSDALRERFGQSAVRHLAEVGALGPGATLVHMNVIEDEDVAILAETGTRVVWCPVAYFNLGLAPAVPCRMPRLLEAGVDVALGTDATRDCTVGDAGFAAHLAARSAGASLAPETLIELQTLLAARAAGLDSITGSLEAGKRADLVVRSADDPAAWPGVNPMHQLALAARAGNASLVVVNGEVVLRDGRSTRVDEERVRFDARRSVERRMQRLGMSRPGQWRRG